MSGTTSVPPPTFGPNGFVAPAEPAVLAGVQEDLDAAFGGGLNFTNQSTPQSQIATSEAAIIGDCNDQFLALANGVDPSYADGRMQDAIGRIYFIERLPAVATVVQVTCSGLPNVPIAVGALVSDNAGNTYACVDGGTIGSGGTVTLGFANTVPGPTPCAAGAITTIVQLQSGWDTVSNAAAGAVGNDVESRSEFELRRQQSVANNSMGMLPSILGSVLQVSGVLSAFVTDNPTASPITIDGVTVPAYGLYVCVSGGEAQAIAQAIWSKKAPGCPYAAGNTTETVYDTSYPTGEQPSYSVTFETATNDPFYFLVTIKNSSSVPSDAATEIQAAVLNAWAGLPPTGAPAGTNGPPRPQINGTIYASNYYAAIQALGAWAEIVNIKIGNTNSSGISCSISGGSGTVLTVSAAGGTIAVGMFVIGVGIPDGTYITSFGSGSGGAGTYNLNNNLGAIGAGSIFVLQPNQDYVQEGGAHMPVLGAADVQVVLA